MYSKYKYINNIMPTGVKYFMKSHDVAHYNKCYLFNSTQSHGLSLITEYSKVHKLSTRRQLGAG